MARTLKSFSRAAAKYRVQPTILVICEDSKSGKKYLEDAVHWFRIRVKVEVVFCGHTDPAGIVREAIKRQRDFDKVFCTVDRDEHKNFDEAVDIVKNHEKISLIASYPCFELWYLLHFKESRKSYARAGKKSPADMLLVDLKKNAGMEKYMKGSENNLFEILFNDFDTARKRSEKIYNQAVLDGNLNPSTNLHELFHKFEQFSQVQLNVKI